MSFICLRKKSFSYQWLRPYPHLETEAWRNSEMAFFWEKYLCQVAKLALKLILSLKSSPYSSYLAIHVLFLWFRRLKTWSKLVFFVLQWRMGAKRTVWILQSKVEVYQGPRRSRKKQSPRDPTKPIKVRNTPQDANKHQRWHFVTYQYIF